MIDAVAGPNRKHVNDGLILSTAKAAGMPLVTSDERLRNRAGEFGVRVLWPRELVAMVWPWV